MLQAQRKTRPIPIRTNASPKSFRIILITLLLLTTFLAVLVAKNHNLPNISYVIEQNGSLEQKPIIDVVRGQNASSLISYRTKIPVRAQLIYGYAPTHLAFKLDNPTYLTNHTFTIETTPTTKQVYFQLKLIDQTGHLSTSDIKSVRIRWF